MLKKYICKNFAECKEAMNATVMDLDFAPGDDPLCPSCRKPLEEAGGGAPPPPWKRIVAIAAGVLVVLVGAGSWFYFSSRPQPAKADTLLIEYFDRLK